MAEHDIIQNAISQLGQSQGDRPAPEFSPGFANVDDRSPEDRMRLIAGDPGNEDPNSPPRVLADLIRFYFCRPKYGTESQLELASSKAWKAFFRRGDARVEEIRAATDGGTPPQLALFLSFLELFELPRASLNRFTERHLDFYFKDVLRFAPRTAIPDHVHVLFELKKNAAPLLIGPSHRLSAGKSKAGVERVYRPVQETVVRTSRIESLRTLFTDEMGHGALRVALVANSADGLGAGLPENDPRFAPFGDPTFPPQLKAAAIGFALSSPILRMREGKRTITLSLTALAPPGVDDDVLASALEVTVSGEKGWLGPYKPKVKITNALIDVTVIVPATDGAVVDYDKAKHGCAFTATAPVVRVVLDPAATTFGHADLVRLGVVLRKVQLIVSVSGMAGLSLESDTGRLDPKKPFQPFGSQPVAGSRLLVGCAEALTKTLTSLNLDLEWHDLPLDFSTRYTDYGVTVTYDLFKVRTAYAEATGSLIRRGPMNLFASSGVARTLDLHGGVVDGTTPLVQTEPGFIALSLTRDFLHSTYRKKTIENALNEIKTVLQEPYTPTIRSLRLNYSGQSALVDVSSTESSAFAESDEVRLFHVDAFGERREHAFLRNQLDWVTDKSVPLVPAHARGELLVGISGIGAGDSTSLLFQVAEGSANPDVTPLAIDWSVLCANHWRSLGADEIVADGTNRLLRSGVFAFLVPAVASTDNTLLPPLVWLRAAVAGNPTFTSKLVGVHANAVEVAYENSGNDPRHLETPLPALSIVKPILPLPSVKSVRQPYASFGGRPIEGSEALRTRASERLRHKNRCITPWDYERVILEAFPRVHRVKCVPHATANGQWLAPGHVLIVVVPDLRNTNARDPLQPRVDLDTLTAIAEHARGRAGPQVRIAVKNPAYQKIRLAFKVRLRPGYEPTFHTHQLKRALTEFLSPWAFDASRPIAFGGTVYRSVLLDFVEELDYVDYVTDFRMYSYVGGSPHGSDRVAVAAAAPDAILVSDDDHEVVAIPSPTTQPPMSGAGQNQC